ncbi:hypothetical protein CEXT_317961 [Caerostris extrusa]|uniref:Ycf15 n=1 Tax=Caerostris extrusa TaxID=172846 RepID=A0AAV4PXV6_CAEEX|nr:hypothetical protein CEXT_317961 [Caerostris extrusa]
MLENNPLLGIRRNRFCKEPYLRDGYLTRMFARTTNWMPNESSEKRFIRMSEREWISLSSRAIIIPGCIRIGRTHPSP